MLWPYFPSISCLVERVIKVLDGKTIETTYWSICPVEKTVITADECVADHE